MRFDHQQCRAPEAGFLTNTHFLTASRFTQRSRASSNSIDDLKGKSVVSTSGTTNIKQLTRSQCRA